MMDDLPPLDAELAQLDRDGFRLVELDYRQHKTRDRMVADQELARPVSDMTARRS